MPIPEQPEVHFELLEQSHQVVHVLRQFEVENLVAHCAQVLLTWLLLFLMHWLILNVCLLLDWLSLCHHHICSGWLRAL